MPEFFAAIKTTQDESDRIDRLELLGVGQKGERLISV